MTFFKFLYVSGLSNFLLLIIKVGVESISNFLTLSILSSNIWFSISLLFTEKTEVPKHTSFIKSYSYLITF